MCLCLDGIFHSITLLKSLLSCSSQNPPGSRHRPPPASLVNWPACCTLFSSSGRFTELCLEKEEEKEGVCGWSGTLHQVTSLAEEVRRWSAASPLDSHRVRRLPTSRLVSPPSAWAPRRGTFITNACLVSHFLSCSGSFKKKKVFCCHRCKICLFKLFATYIFLGRFCRRLKTTRLWGDNREQE